MVEFAPEREQNIPSFMCMHLFNFIWKWNVCSLKTETLTCKIHLNLVKCMKALSNGLTSNFYIFSTKRLNKILQV